MWINKLTCLIIHLLILNIIWRRYRAMRAKAYQVDFQCHAHISEDQGNVFSFEMTCSQHDDSQPLLIFLTYITTKNQYTNIFKTQVLGEH